MIIEGKHSEVGQGIFISDIQEGSAAHLVTMHLPFFEHNNHYHICMPNYFKFILPHFNLFSLFVNIVRVLNMMFYTGRS